MKPPASSASSATCCSVVAMATYRLAARLGGRQVLELGRRVARPERSEGRGPSTMMAHPRPSQAQGVPPRTVLTPNPKQLVFHVELAGLALRRSAVRRTLF